MESQARSNYLIRLHIDEIKPKKVTGLACLLVVIIILFFIISVFVPDAVVMTQDNDTPAYTGIRYHNQTLEVGKFDLNNFPVYSTRIMGVSGMNQFLYMEMNIKRNRNSTTGMSKSYTTRTLNYTVYVYNMVNNRTIDKLISSQENAQVEIKCDENECDDPTIVFIPAVKYNNYLIYLKFKFDDEMKKLIREDVEFASFRISREYTSYLFGLRYTFMVASMIGTFLFLWRMSKIGPMREWVFEQKWILLLSFGLIFFNNPFYAIIILLPGETSNIFSTFFTVNFLIVLYGFWLTTYQRIRLENQKKASKTVTLPKIVFLFCFWAFTIVSLCLFNHFYLRDPGFDFGNTHQKAFMAFKIIALIFAATALIWLLAEWVYILSHLNTRIWRQKLLFSISSFFILVFFVFIFSGALSSYSQEGPRLLLAIAFLNIYVFMLQYFYTPTEKGIKEASEIERREQQRPNRNYDVLEDNIQFDFDSPYAENPNQNQNLDNTADIPNPEFRAEIQDIEVELSGDVKKNKGEFNKNDFYQNEPNNNEFSKNKQGYSNSNSFAKDENKGVFSGEIGDDIGGAYDDNDDIPDLEASKKTPFDHDDDDRVPPPFDL